MRITGEIKIITGAALFALIPVCVVLGKDLSVYGLLFGRLLIASLILFILHREKKKLFMLKRKQFFMLFGWSQLMLGAMICFFLAINYSSMAVASALLGTQPVIIVFLAAFILKEKITINAFVAALMTLIGIFCITGLRDFSTPNYLIGEILAICSAAFLGLNFILQKKYLTNYSGRELVLYSGVFQLVFLIPLLFVNLGQLTVNSITAIVILAVVCTVLAYSLIYDGIKEVDAQKIGVLQSIEYILPLLFGIVFFKEIPEISVIIGMALIIAACFIVGFRTKLKD